MSALGRYAHLHRDANPVDARVAARDAWHRHGIVLINPEWFTSWTDRKQAELLAEKLHGKRKVAR